MNKKKYLRSFAVYWIGFMVIMAGVFLICSEKIQAAVKAPEKTTCRVGAHRVFYYGVPHEAEYGFINIQHNVGDYVTNVKASSSNLKMLLQRNVGESDGSTEYTKILLYAKKAGTYQVTFDIYSAEKKHRSSHKVAVRAEESLDGVIKSVTINGKNRNKSIYTVDSEIGIRNYYYTVSYSGRIMFKLRDGLKIKKIEVLKRDSNGKMKKNTFKNGSKITYSSNGDEWHYQYDTIVGLSRYQRAETQFIIHYTKGGSRQVYQSLFVVRVPARKWVKVID